MKHILKQYGGVETYEASKLKLSIKRTLLSCGTTDQSAQVQAKQVTDQFSIWLAPKAEITSLDIRIKITELLMKKNKCAAILYKNHKQLW